MCGIKAHNCDSFLTTGERCGVAGALSFVSQHGHEFSQRGAVFQE